MLKEIKNATQHYFVDEQELQQGEYKEWHYDGTLWLHCFQVDGNYHGEYKLYHGTGKINVHCFYSNGQLHGEYKKHIDDGVLWKQCLYKNNIRHGEYKEYWYNGALRNHYFYIDGKETSFYKLPYPKTGEDRIYFTLKYGIPLLPVENVC